MSETTTASPPTPAPPPTTEAPPASVVPTAAPADWRSNLPPEIRDAPAIGRFDAPEKLAKSYLELETLVGRKGVVIPTDKDPPDVHARYRAALGVPDSPEAYGLKPPEGIPDGLWSDATATAFAGMAHKHGLTPAQAQGLAAEFLSFQAQQMPDVEAMRASAESELRREWGAAFAAKADHAKRAVRQFGGDALVEYLETTGLGNDPRMVRAFAAIGAAMAEDVPAGMGQGRAGVMSPDSARAEANRLMADPSGPYWNDRHPEHRAVAQRVKDLWLMASGG